MAVTDKGKEIGLIISKVERQLRRFGDSPLEGTTKHSKHQQMIVARERLPDISTSTMMRSLPLFVMRKPF